MKFKHYETIGQSKTATVIDICDRGLRGVLKQASLYGSNTFVMTESDFALIEEFHAEMKVETGDVTHKIWLAAGYIEGEFLREDEKTRESFGQIRDVTLSREAIAIGLRMAS